MVTQKTGSDRPTQESMERNLKEAGREVSTRDGISVRRSKNKLQKVFIVNEKLERKRARRKILIWIVSVPLGAYLIVWLLILAADMVNFSLQ